MSLWLGRPGAMLALPDPLPGVSATLTRPYGEHTTLAGGRVVDFTGDGRRMFVLRWERLSHAEYAILEAFHGGVWGTGPWHLLTADPGWNLLVGNVAAAGDVTGDPSGFGTDPAAALAVDHPLGFAPLTGTRVLVWTVPAAPADDVPLHAGTMPTLAGVPIVFTAHLRANPPVQVRASIGWYGAGGVDLSDSDGPPVTLGAAWSPVTIPAAPPAEATAAALAVKVVAASATAETVLHVDALSAHLAAPATEWRPGRGVPLVSLVELTDLYPWADLHDCEARLLEVG